MADFVPYDRLLQKAYFPVILIDKVVAYLYDNFTIVPKRITIRAHDRAISLKANEIVGGIYSCCQFSILPG